MEIKVLHWLWSCIQAAQKGQAEAEAAAKVKRGEITKMEAEADKHRQEAASMKRKAEALAKEAERAETALRDVRGRAEQRRAEATARTSQSAVVAALLAAKAQGQISGIHGRLGTSMSWVLFGCCTYMSRVLSTCCNPLLRPFVTGTKKQLSWLMPDSGQGWRLLL